MKQNQAGTAGNDHGVNSRIQYTVRVAAPPGNLSFPGGEVTGMWVTGFGWHEHHPPKLLTPSGLWSHGRPGEKSVRTGPRKHGFDYPHDSLTVDRSFPPARPRPALRGRHRRTGVLLVERARPARTATSPAAPAPSATPTTPSPAPHRRCPPRRMGSTPARAQSDAVNVQRAAIGVMSGGRPSWVSWMTSMTAGPPAATARSRAAGRSVASVTRSPWAPCRRANSARSGLS